MTHPVEVVGLTKRFGDFTAVDDVTFSIREGEIFGFLGPNGAGKTTTIKMLTGLLVPTAGSGSVAGIPIVSPSGKKDTSSSSPSLGHTLGYMSQKFSLYPDLTVAENIGLVAGLYGVTGSRFAERRDWVLETAGLVGREKLLAGALPLGWKQRLALGCAVLHEPPILFLDEPTSGVDPLARRRFWDLIDAMAADGTTILVSTHYMEEAAYCHRLALMNRGRLIALDSPRKLVDDMSEPILRLSIDDPPRAVGAITELPGVLEVGMFGRDLHVVLENEAAETAIPSALAAAGIALQSSSRIRPSLEDVFVTMVRNAGGAPVA